MRRGTIGFDRSVGVVLGVVLVLLGLLGIGWWQGVLLRRVPRAADAGRSAASGLDGAVGASWWPLVAGIVGLVLAVLGIIWLLRHAASRGVRRYRLSGTGKTGSLTANHGALLAAACADLNDSRGIRSASGSMSQEGGGLIADLRVTADPGADLSAVGGDIDRTVGDLARALDDPTVSYRARLSVARRRKLPA